MRQRLVTSAGTTIALRPAMPDDEGFLYDLYADRRRPEFELLGWGPAESEAFTDMQFGAQQRGYGATFPDAEHWIVLVGDQMVGRLLVAHGDDEDLVVDLVIVSGHRGQGIGTSLMQEVVTGAADRGASVRLTVETYDQRLVRWYESLGFSVTEPGEVTLRMDRFPDGHRHESG